MVVNVIFPRHLTVGRNINPCALLIRKDFSDPLGNNLLGVVTHSGHGIRPPLRGVGGIAPGPVRRGKPVWQRDKPGLGIGADTSRFDHANALVRPTGRGPSLPGSIIFRSRVYLLAQIPWVKNTLILPPLLVCLNGSIGSGFRFGV